MINNSVMKCCICSNKKNGEFTIINNNKYHLCCIEDLQQRIDKAIEYIKKDSWHYAYEDDYDLYLCESELEELLEILKGDVSDEEK